MNTTQLILAISGLFITVAGVVVPLIIGVYTLKKRFDWDKSILASKLSDVWTEKTLEHRNVIE